MKRALLMTLLLMGCIQQDIVLDMNVSADKEVYRSAETLNLTLTISSNSNVNATVLMTGISGRMNIERAIELDAGNNLLFVDYKLPSCNVCGGIRPGNHDILTKVIYGNVTLNKTIAVEIQQ